MVAVMVFAYSSACAEEADIIDAQVQKGAAGTYRFDVTVAHRDTGWEHYADKWDIIDQKGTILGTRVLHHPHVDEQPFTRGLLGVEIPSGTNEVAVRAHDSVHEYGGHVMHVKIP